MIQRNLLLLRVEGKEIVSSSIKRKDKAITVTVREGPKACETSRIPHFLDNQLIDDSEVVDLMCRPPFTPMKIPVTHFC
jgi:hypothetical protein